MVNETESPTVIVFQILMAWYFKSTTQEGQVDPDKKPKDPQAAQKFQTLPKKQVAKLAKILAHQVQEFWLNENIFISNAEAEIERLSKSEYGVEMLNTIGYVYTRQATKELGKNASHLGLPYAGESLRNKCHVIKSKVIAATEELTEYLQPHKRVISDCRWKLIVPNIEATLTRVCQLVLRDPEAEDDELHERAIALKKLGMIFQGNKPQKNERNDASTHRKSSQVSHDRYCSGLHRIPCDN